MKRALITFFVMLLILLIGIAYTYFTEKTFHSFVDSLIANKRDSVQNDFPKEFEDSQIAKSEARPRAAKKLKPDQFFELDQYACNTPKQYEKDIQTLADYLIKPAKNDLEKARVLFTWVATHVRYDDDAYNSENYPDDSPENVLSGKKAVCEGYANILKALCDAAKLESEKIGGYAKGYSYSVGSKFKEANHAWNAIRINGEWKLFDATWASGYGMKVKGKLVSKKRFDPYWFEVKPKEFIFSHLPEDSVWQLLERPISLRQYESFPNDAHFFKTGLNADTAFLRAMKKDSVK